MNLPPLQFKENGPVMDINTKSATNAKGAVQLAYVEGAQKMADMFRKLIYNGNLKQLVDLARKTETTSFYDDAIL